jgi:hypothetical protein
VTGGEFLDREWDSLRIGNWDYLHNY